MLKIDRGIPMPPPKRRVPTKYPWIDLKVSESFFVPEGILANFRSAASRASTTYKRTFIARQVADGVRVWRTK